MMHSLKFITGVLRPQIRHAHDLDNQTCPSSEVLRPLTSAGVWVVLLPREPCFLPAFVDGVDQVLPQLSVDLTGLFLMRS